MSWGAKITTRPRLQVVAREDKTKSGHPPITHPTMSDAMTHGLIYCPSNMSSRPTSKWLAETYRTVSCSQCRALLPQHFGRPLPIDLDGEYFKHPKYRLRSGLLASVLFRAWDCFCLIGHRGLAAELELEAKGWAMAPISIDGVPLDTYASMCAPASCRVYVHPSNPMRLEYCKVCGRRCEPYYAGAGFWVSKTELQGRDLVASDTGTELLMSDARFSRVSETFRSQLRLSDQLQVRDPVDP